MSAKPPPLTVVRGGASRCRPYVLRVVFLYDHWGGKTRLNGGWEEHAWHFDRWHLAYCSETSGGKRLGNLQPQRNLPRYAGRPCKPPLSTGIGQSRNVRKRTGRRTRWGVNVVAGPLFRFLDCLAFGSKGVSRFAKSFLRKRRVSLAFEGESAFWQSRNMSR